MGFLDRFFDTGEPNQNPFWNLISTEAEMDEIIASSNEHPQIILKHSHQCGTSFFAKKNLETIHKVDLSGADIFLVDVIRQRELSRYLSEKVGVRHESPQLLVFKDGVVVWHGSHHQVTPENMMVALG